VAQLLALPPHSKEVLGSIPAWDAVGTGVRFSPGLQCSGGLSPGPFCVEFACSPRAHKGFPPLRTPTEKTCKRTEHSWSIPDQDRRFTSLGPRALKSCPLLLGSWRKDSPGWEKTEAKFTATLGLRVCVCVCVLCRLHISTCVFQCGVCAINTSQNINIKIVCPGAV